MKEKENIESWQNTAYRRFAKLGRKHCARIIKRIPLGLQPVATMQGGRCTTSPRLHILWVETRFYQTIHAAGMKERKGEMDKRAKDFSPQHGKTGDVAAMRLFRRGTDCGPLS